ncbi:MAG: hypothetical protein R3F54_03850 [Alphaproteobacteria bacterium]
MSTRLKLALLAIGALAVLSPVGDGANALDLEKAHATAIQNCMNWNGESRDYCTCVQDKVRAGLPGESYMAMMEFAQAYEENRRADLAAMQVDAKLSKALEPVDAVVTGAKEACQG